MCPILIIQLQLRMHKQLWCQE